MIFVMPKAGFITVPKLKKESEYSIETFRELLKSRLGIVTNVHLEIEWLAMSSYCWDVGGWLPNICFPHGNEYIFNHGSWKM